MNDCKQFLLPFLNEVFGEHYDGSEQIEFRPNEHFIDGQDESDQNLTENGEISFFDKRTIIELTDDVMKELTRKYNSIQKEVGELMSGAMIQTEARRLRDEGLELGRNEGRIEGRIEGGAQMLIKMGREYGIDDASLLDRLRKELGISPECAAEYLDKYGNPLA